jgi:hypothetical protein
MAQDTGIGIFAAFVEGILLQPTLYWKNAKAQNKPFTINPTVIYRGSVASIFNECQMMGIQFGVTALISRHLGEDTTSGQSVGSIEMISAMGGGGMGACFATPVELIMIQQQNNGGSILHTFERLGVSANPTLVWRGLSMALIRDSIYVGAMLGFTPILNRHFQREYGCNPKASNFYASIVGGIVAGVSSHPFDLIKTCMQGDLTGKKYASASQTARAIWAEGGLRRLYSGGFWRTLNITATVYIANEINIWAKAYLNPTKSED